ncbi:unnamed protein product [Microthlaspi erraticum]|uniref:Uncharacterized protein n=1 Tax=Microthlaspi erraticum TaxID=1685480 RepID=A0A6D2JLS7_9BRAS|nr:unnamed protein product [Microthlaspi erraticum]
MMAGNLWRTWPYQQNAMESMKVWSSTARSIELDAQMRKDMLALNSKLDKLILAQFPAKHVNYVSEQTLVKDQEGEETTQEVCYIQNRQGSYRNPQQGDTTIIKPPGRTNNNVPQGSTQGLLIPNQLKIGI